ncbi:CPBP family intramembrane metalloprotease [Bacillus timonensis]|nr:CPBP family intramembrane metalloprotease [Bacillus timonensis]
MLPSKLIRQITKKDIALLLFITIGIDIVLYFTNYSHLMSTLYQLICMISFYVGIKLHRALKPEENAKQPFHKLFFQFTIVYLIFYTSVGMVDSLTYSIFEPYWNNHEQVVEEANDYLQTVEEDIPESPTQDERMFYIFSIVDYVGYDFLSSILAGTEEIWRLAYIALILLFFKGIIGSRWEYMNHTPFLYIAVAVSSILFGWSHTFTADYELPVFIGTTVLTGISGAVFAVLLLWTRNLWMLVLTHALYDVLVTISWFYFDIMLEATAILLLLISAVLYIINEKKEQKLKTPMTNERGAL